VPLIDRSIEVTASQLVESKVTRVGVEQFSPSMRMILRQSIDRR